MAFQTVSLDYIGSTYGVGLKNESSVGTDLQAYGGTDAWVSQRKLSFWIRGYNSLAGARSALETFLHITYDDANGVPHLDGLPWAELSIDNTPSPLVYTADVTFRSLTEEEKLTRSGINDSTYTLPAVRADQITFSSGSENEHIDFSEETSWIWSKTSYQWDFNNLIDFANGTVGGYDRLAQSIDFTFSLPLPKTWFTNNSGAMMKTYLGLVGTINSASFYFFDPYTVLFQSFNANPTYFTKKDDDTSTQDWYWDTQFNFNVKPSRTVTMPDGTTMETVVGHDYMWNSVTSVTKYTNYSDYNVQQVNCERVYRASDFSSLGVTFEGVDDEKE